MTPHVTSFKLSKSSRTWQSSVKILPNAGGGFSIPDKGTKIPHAALCSQNLKYKLIKVYTDCFKIEIFTTRK